MAFKALLPILAKPHFNNMLSTVVQMDISTEGELKHDFVGSIFRGWLGFVLKCDPEISCYGCDKTSKCPYFMVFKEQNSIKPYSLLAFKNRGYLSCFIKLHGERRKFGILFKLSGNPFIFQCTFFSD